MSKYTTELRYICESLAGLTESTGYDDTENIIEAARPKLFDFSYDVPAAHKKSLETNIINYFYTREIGAETYGRFHLFLRSKMMLIMPYFTEMYGAIENKLFENVDYAETRAASGRRDSTGTSKDSGSAKGVIYDLFSDTPQSGLTGVDTGTYLTSATKNTSDSETASSGETTDAETHSDDSSARIKGKNGGQSYAELIKELRGEVLSVDMMVIEELEPLFMQIW